MLPEVYVFPTNQLKFYSSFRFSLTISWTLYDLVLNFGSWNGDNFDLSTGKISFKFFIYKWTVEISCLINFSMKKI